MQRHWLKLALESTTRSSRRTTRTTTTSLRPSWRRQLDHSPASLLTKLQPTVSFTTATTSSSDFSNLSHRDLEQLALKYARQGNPKEAQVVMEQLVQAQGADDEVGIIWTSVIDAWSEYQRQKIALLKEILASEDLSLAVLHDRLDEIQEATLAASELVEAELKKNSKQVSLHHVLAILKMWANLCEASRMVHMPNKSKGKSGIPQRAHHILTTYQSISVKSLSSIECVNQILKCWAYSNEHLRGTMAEQVFQQYFQKTTREGVNLPSPDGNSYRYMILAWCWSQETRSAFTATGHLMRMMRLMEDDKPDMEPTLDDYHTLLEAWTTAEDKNAPSKVYSVLQLADNAYRKGQTKVRLDSHCYRFALQAMGRRVNVPEVGDLIDKTLLEMKRDRMIIPNTECYGAAILGWKNVATSRDSDDRERASQRCFALLQEMITAFQRTTVVIIRPSSEHYNLVLEALTMSKKAKSFLQAKQLLEDLESQSVYVAGVVADSDKEAVKLKPTAESYLLVFKVLRNSRYSNKVEAAMDILARFKSRADDLKKNSTDESMVDALSAFISVCAQEGASKEDSHRMETMFMALESIDEIRALGLTPMSTTYAALLEACDNLVPIGQERQRLLENIFTRACEEGYVDQAVLEAFKVAASTYLYAKLVVAQSKQVENMKVVPESWTRNVKGFSANSKGGRKVLPLTIEGQFTFTKAAAEYKMRKLRKQANKKMLQGGRLK